MRIRQVAFQLSGVRAGSFALLCQGHRHGWGRQLAGFGAGAVERLRGTAAADDANVVLNTPSLYELAGLDRDRWTVVGLDFSLGGSPDEALVLYATDRTAEALAPAEVEGEVKVTAFALGHSVQLDQFLAQAFNRVTVRLLSSTVGTAELSVIEHVRPDGESPSSAPAD